MKKISIQFFCGHFESLTRAEIKKQKISICPVFKINGQNKATCGDYCLKCSKPKKTYSPFNDSQEYHESFA